MRMPNEIRTITRYPPHPAGIVITHGLSDHEDKTICGTTIKNYRHDASWYVKQFIGGWTDKRIDYTEHVTCLRCRKSIGLIA